MCFDSVHGRWDHEVSGDGDVLSVDGQQISYSAAAAPRELPWSEHGAQIVLECSGFRTIASLAPYFEQAFAR